MVNKDMEICSISLTFMERQVDITHLSEQVGKVVIDFSAIRPDVGIDEKKQHHLYSAGESINNEATPENGLSVS